jgi:uncharacterized membrane protein YhaH (DUF805 family)
MYRDANAMLKASGWLTALLVVLRAFGLLRWPWAWSFFPLMAVAYVTLITLIINTRNKNG